MSHRHIDIPEDELELRSILSSGPGGQNVNKVATAVQLRFDVRRSPSLPETVRARLIALAGNRINRAGELVLTARRFRTREANRRDVLERLARLVERASLPPKPRKKTRVPKAARRRRLEDKRRRATTKALRKNPREQ